MKRRAESESLEVAAPDDRIDVEAPVANDTDADAQASQYDLGDFANNAGDNIADPDLSSDSQIWAVGEGDKTAARADGIAAVRYAESCIKAGLAPEEDRWKLAAQAQTMKASVVNDRIRLQERFAAVLDDVRSRARTASASRTASALPRGLTAPVRGTQRIAANDPTNDSALFY